MTDLTASLVTPDTVPTRLGVLSSCDAAPSPETVEILRDNLDFERAVDVSHRALGACRTGSVEVVFALEAGHDHEPGERHSLARR